MAFDAMVSANFSWNFKRLNRMLKSIVKPKIVLILAIASPMSLVRLTEGKTYVSLRYWNPCCSVSTSNSFPMTTTVSSSNLALGFFLKMQAIDSNSGFKNIANTRIRTGCTHWHCQWPRWLWLLSSRPLDSHGHQCYGRKRGIMRKSEGRWSRCDKNQRI